MPHVWPFTRRSIPYVRIGIATSCQSRHRKPHVVLPRIVPSRQPGLLSSTPSPNQTPIPPMVPTATPSKSPAQAVPNAETQSRPGDAETPPGHGRTPSMFRRQVQRPARVIKTAPDVEPGQREVGEREGSEWVSLGDGIQGCSGASNCCEGVLALRSFEGDVIAAGEFTQAGGSPAKGIARW